MGGMNMNTKEKYKEYVNTAFVAAVDPLVIERAEGATYYGDDGRSYIDCWAGIAVVNNGHCNEAVISAARQQMEKLVHCCSYTFHAKPVADLAEKMAEITPANLKKSFFGNSGAEAIEGAVRLAKRYTKKNEAIALTHSFHGRTYGTLSLTGNAGRKKGGGPYMPGVAFAPAPYCYRCPLKLYDPDTCGMACAEAIDDVIKFETSDNVAFFVAEPIMGEGGIIVPPVNYFQTVKKVLDENNVLFIADEVQSGFCRSGKLFAIEHYGVDPDIIVMAKGIANGFPLSCFIAPDEIADAFQVGDHLSTFGGNPVSCAASLANIRFMEENKIAEQAAEKGNQVLSALQEINPRQVTIGEIRCQGLMVGIEVVQDADSKAPASAEAARIRKAMRDKGVLLGLGGVYGNVLRIQPPLTIGDDELEKVLVSMKEVMEA
jgi:4-aminobutyrate aminotransferase